MVVNNSRLRYFHSWTCKAAERRSKFTAEHRELALKHLGGALLYNLFGWGDGTMSNVLPRRGFYEYIPIHFTSAVSACLAVNID